MPRRIIATSLGATAARIADVSQGSLRSCRLQLSHEFGRVTIDYQHLAIPERATGHVPGFPLRDGAIDRLALTALGSIVDARL
jgi:hypothetical protein